MKRFVALSLLCTTIGFLAAGCAVGKISKVSEEIKVTKPLVRYTFISPLAGRKYWDSVIEGMKSADKSFDVNVKFTGPSKLNTEDQIRDIEVAIASKVDGIVTTAINPKAFKPVIDRAVESGIPVVLIDTDAPKSKRAAYVGTNNKSAGAEAGKAMVKATGGKAYIAILTATLDQENLNERISGFKEIIKFYPEMRIITIAEGNSDVLRINERVQNILKTYPYVDAIFCAEGTGTRNVPGIIGDKKLNGKVAVVGFDGGQVAFDFIKKGLLYSSVMQNPYEMGYVSIEILNQIRDRKASIDPVFYTEISVVTKDNVNTYENSNN